MKPQPRSPFSVNWLVHSIHRRCVEAAVGRCARGRILDVGCGEQPFAPLLAAAGDALTHLEFDRRRFAATPPGRMGGRPRPAVSREGSFQTVVSFQVLEHVPRPALMVEEMARVLAPGGRLIVTAPHMWGVHEEPRDYFRFTGFGLRQLAGDAGLEVADVQALAGYWVTAAARACHYLQRFEKIGLFWVTRPLYALIQTAGLFLDRLHRVEGDAWNFLLIAERPGGGETQ